MCTITCPITEAVPQRCFYKKLLFKHAAVLQKKKLCRSVISINFQSKFIEIIFRHGCSPVNLLHI